MCAAGQTTEVYVEDTATGVLLHLVQVRNTGTVVLL